MNKFPELDSLELGSLVGRKVNGAACAAWCVRRVLCKRVAGRDVHQPARPKYICRAARSFVKTHESFASALRKLYRSLVRVLRELYENLYVSVIAANER